MKQIPVIVLSLLASATCFGGCSSVQGIRVPVLRPSAVNLTAYEQLAVDKFDGPGASELAREFALALRQAKNPATGKAGFQVMDHSEVDRLLDRIRGSRGDVDPRSKEVLERWRNVDLLLKGQITDNQVKERVIVTPGVDEYGHKQVHFTRRATAVVELAIVALDGQDQMIDRVTLRARTKAQTQRINGKPRNIDHDALLARAHRQVIRQYLLRVLPRREYIRVRLYKDKALPDLSIGNGLAQSGDWQAAHDSYERALEQATGEQENIRFKPLFNLGVALEFTNQFDEAKAKLQDAYRLEQKRLIRDEMNRLARRERDVQRLQEQVKTAAPNR